jgi:two-component system sensor histidine kinase KdpD
VSVADDGPGVPPERLPELFNKFVQVNRPAGGGGYKGTGLGLAICQESLRLNGGRIWAENRPEGGARFSFSVPVWSEELQKGGKSGQAAGKDSAGR